MSKRLGKTDAIKPLNKSFNSSFICYGCPVGKRGLNGDWMYKHAGRGWAFCDDCAAELLVNTFVPTAVLRRAKRGSP